MLGKCKPGYLVDGTACDDGNVCSDADSCAAGTCQGKGIDVAKACDDGNPCSNDSCLVGSGCAHSANSSPCSDGNACTQNDVCANSSCAGLPINATADCDDGKVCTDDGCDAKTGCSHSNNTAACSDGNACTEGDLCAAGSCGSGKNVCACQQDSDCALYEDGDLCNGTLVCNKSKAPFQCTVAAASVVVCATNGDGPCEASVCGAKTGKCAKSPANAGKGCDADGSACTVADACADGACVAGAKANCDDKNPCTTDSCDPKTGCVYLANTATCDADNTVCTAGDTCKDKACLAGPKLGCDDGNPCTDDGCDAKLGCTKVANKAACDADGSVCSKDDTCSGGACLPGAALNCDDGKACTDDSCDPKQGCKNVANAKACDADGSVCTQNDACSGGACVAGAKLVCADGNVCTTDGCDAKLGCQFPAGADGAGCDDGNGCTTGDKCTAGKCGGTGKSCDDGNACTADSCVNDLCSNVNTTLACDDGNNCTQNDVCDGKGACVGKAVVCDDGNPCTDDACVKGQGCVKTNNTAVCDDGQVCTVGDACSAGVCKAGAVKNCDDLNPCNVDYCNEASGQCIHTAKDGPCDDGDTCTSGDACSSQKCLAGKPVLFTATFDFGANYDYPYAVASLPDGFAIAGSTSNGNGLGQGWLVRTDVHGEKSWQSLYGTSGDQRVHDLLQLADGFLLAGSTNSKGAGSHDFWLIRTGLQGNQLWDKTYGAANQERAYACAATLDGGFAVAGETSSKGAGDADFWLVRTDAQGGALWDKAFGGSGWDQAQAVAALADGGIAVLGMTNSSNLPGSQGTKGSLDFWLVRTDSNGNLLWNKTYGGYSADDAAELAVLPDGGFALAGNTMSKGAGGADFWLVRTDAQGKVLWDRTYGAAGDESASGLVALADGFALTGLVSASGQGIKFWLVRTDVLGNAVFNKSFGGSQEYANNVIAMPSGFAVIGASGDAKFVRTDPWGNATCTDSGPCASKTLADCADTNPCTADLCDAAHNGCYHTNLPDASPCGTTKTCKSGTCQ